MTKKILVLALRGGDYWGVYHLRSCASFLQGAGNQAVFRVNIVEVMYLSKPDIGVCIAHHKCHKTQNQLHIGQNVCYGP